MQTIEERKGPGRPSNAEIAARAAQTEESAPRNRKPFNTTEPKLGYPPREGFHRHWFNDVPGRVQRAEEAGYKIVKGDDGKPVSRVVGTAEGGGPLHGFLMEIPKEWFEEDMKRQAAEVNAREEAMRRGKLNQDENSYVPSQGISIKHGK